MFLTLTSCISSALSKKVELLEEAVTRVADKVNARADTVLGLLDAMEGQIDTTVTDGIRLGASLSLVAVSSWKHKDYSSVPVGFHGGAPEDMVDIGEELNALQGHADAIADNTHPQSALNRLFD